MKKIDGSPKSLKQLLQNTKYSIHYYQREYMWQRKHIEELIDDLTTEFLIYYKSGDDRIAVQDYGAYFMGSIVLAGRENAIIDGQQRFSSLTLLLMYLNNRLRVTGQSYSVIEQMIFSEAYGTKSFNINVDDRAECMNAIFNDKTFDTTGVGESVKNLYGRYTDIVEIFPINDITDGMLLHFCDWLAEKVFFIEIVATTEQDAHKVFATMNAGAINQDFDIIGGPFHKWVRDERVKLRLSTTDDFEAFIMQFSKFAEIYTKIKEAESTFSEETKYIYYNSQVNFTLQPQLLLAPICYDDSWETITEKMNLVARFIDLLITARVTNYRSVDYSTIKNYVFTVSKDIRRCTTNELKQRLKQQYEKLSYDPASALPELRLNSFTKKYIKNMIARITGYIEEQTGVVSKYCEYMDTKTKNPFEIEHIISDHYEWFTDEYADQEEFKRWRNSIGALLLLHKSINASLNDSKYDHKLTKYCSTEGNIYTESLGDLAYQHNPKFLKFVSENNLLFKAYPKFGKAEISERIQLLIQLVKLIWNSEMFN